MSETQAFASADETLRARAAYLKTRLLEDERWSFRTLAARTGIGKGKLEARLNGDTEVSLSDVIVFAEVLREQPDDLFAKLRHIEGFNSPSTPAGAGSLTNGPTKD